MQPYSCVLGVNLIILATKGTLFVVVNIYFVEISDSVKQRFPSTSCSKGIQQFRDNGKFNIKDV